MFYSIPRGDSEINRLSAQFETEVQLCIDETQERKTRLAARGARLRHQIEFIDAQYAAVIASQPTTITKRKKDAAIELESLKVLGVCDIFYTFCSHSLISTACRTRIMGIYCNERQCKTTNMEIIFTIHSMGPFVSINIETEDTTIDITSKDSAGTCVDVRR